MAKVTTDDGHYKSIANAIRENADDILDGVLMRPDEMPEHIVGVAQLNYGKGRSEAYEEGYNSFWDAFQVHGTRTNYQRAFANGWNEKTFRPKYDIRATDAAYIFSASKISCDLREILERQNIVLDFSRAGNNVAYAFSNSMFTALPAIDLSNLTADDYRTDGIFGWTEKLQTIDSIILKNDGTTVVRQNWFNSASGLENLRIKGRIGASGFNVGSCTKLSRESIESIISALLDTVSDASVTFSLAAVNRAFETAEGKKDGAASEDWAALLESKENWTVNLV